MNTYSHEHLAGFCLGWDSLQEIDSSWTLLFQRDATIWARYTLSFVRCLCERSYALTYRIWVGWRGDRLLNKWLLSHKGRQPLMSLSSQLARPMSSSRPVSFSTLVALAFFYSVLCVCYCNASVPQRNTECKSTGWFREQSPWSFITFSWWSWSANSQHVLFVIISEQATLTIDWMLINKWRVEFMTVKRVLNIKAHSCY